ncbi:MAG: NAD(P)H-dependent oxidoreductase [Desulfobacterales bacterium]|jgi:FMN-dependent NADH-azoreductase
MSNLLYIQASPRGERSYAIQAADAFIQAYREVNDGDSVTTINLFEKDLPPFDGFSLDAKYAILHGEEHTEAQAMAWKGVETVIGEFTGADKYVFAVPMWNFSIPYRLKHYFDVIVQPGYTFSFSPEEGYTGLVTGKPVFAAYARGGQYPPKSEMAAYDLQSRYLEVILGFIGLTDVKSVFVEPTLAGGPEGAEKALASAVAKAEKLAKKF